jgi:hypothetical protein
MFHMIVSICSHFDHLIPTHFLPNILTAVKDKRQMYCATTYARNGVNQMWILENSKELLANLKA